MDTKDSVGFVGFYASFPIEKNRRRVEILKTILDMEEELRFKRVRSGLLLAKLKDSVFSEEKLQRILQSLETGEADYLQLFQYNIGDDWVQASKTSIGLDWSSIVLEPPKSRSPSPLETRYGSVGWIKAQFPLSRFEVDSESEFQKRLLRVLKGLFVKEGIYWAFVHKGFHFIAPSSVGTDDLFRDTREKFPLTSFDADLGRAVFFKEFVKGAFWANFLNPLHLRRLGGKERLMHERPSRIVEDLGDERILLQVGPSPLTGDESKAVEDSQRLRRFLRPILMETGEDMMRIQKEILGSWKPPADTDRKWQEDLAVIRKQYP
jgi:hypothetical protein